MLLITLIARIIKGYFKNLLKVHYQNYNSLFIFKNSVLKQIFYLMYQKGHPLTEKYFSHQVHLIRANCFRRLSYFLLLHFYFLYYIVNIELKVTKKKWVMSFKFEENICFTEKSRILRLYLLQYLMKNICCNRFLLRI